MRGTRAASSKDSLNSQKALSPDQFQHSLLRVEPITKLTDDIQFTKECLLSRLHSEMRHEREQIESSLFGSRASGGHVDYTPLSEIAIRHARRAELVSGLTSHDLETIELVAKSICDGHIGEMEELLRQIDCSRIAPLSEGLGLVLRTESFWIGTANGWLHFINKESGRYFSYPIGAVDICPSSSESRVEKSAS